METFLGIDYPTLWFLVVGGLFSGYAILDGFDFGAGAWHLFFRKEEERRIALNAVGPVWDGNEVWLVIGGGALFAGFPVLYASMFSAMYIPFMLFLLFIIFRAISIEFRGKENMRWWKNLWDISYSISSIMLSLLLGVVLGNVLQGMALDSDYEFTGHWLEFLNPYALLVGLTTLALFMTHGAIFLLLKTEGRMFEQLRKMLKAGMAIFILLFLIVTIYTLVNIPHLTDTYLEQPLYFVVPILGFLSIANLPRLATSKNYRMAFVFSALTMSFMLITVAIELYPVLLISTLSEQYSITIYNAASSDKSLGIMLLMAAIGTPLVLAYTIFVYKTFWGKVKLDETSY
ncbi:MAG: cytochrome d ubiquinol oxidase subunit II [bacterium]